MCLACRREVRFFVTSWGEQEKELIPKFGAWNFLYELSVCCINVIHITLYVHTNVVSVL